MRIRAARIVSLAHFGFALRHKKHGGSVPAPPHERALTNPKAHLFNLIPAFPLFLRKLKCLDFSMVMKNQAFCSAPLRKTLCRIRTFYSSD